MTNKVDGITLLQMIKDGKIKDGNKISCSDFVSSYYFKSGTLGYYNKDENGIIKFVELSLKDIIENIKYATYEIIEEIEKPKEIELLNIECDDKHQNYYIVNECGTKCFLTKHSKMIAEQQNEIAKAVNYLLEKSDKE